MKTTTTKTRLGDLGTGHVWFTSVGQPTGCDLTAEYGEPLHLPGDNLGGDTSPWWDLTGTVAPDGEWTWDGEGNPTDWKSNTVTKIVAFTTAIPDDLRPTAERVRNALNQ